MVNRRGFTPQLGSLFVLGALLVAASACGPDARVAFGLDGTDDEAEALTLGGASRENVTFYYQPVPDTFAEATAKFGRSKLVVVGGQGSDAKEIAAVNLIHQTGAKAYRVMQWVWFRDVSTLQQGIDFHAHLGEWSFCRSGATPLTGIADGAQPKVYGDFNERALHDATVGYIDGVFNRWGYDGIFVDMGGRVLAGNEDHDGIGARENWYRTSTCTSDPVVPGATMSDAYVQMLRDARATKPGAEILLNYGGSPHVAPVMRPDPKSAACRARDWAHCPRLDDVWPLVDWVLDEAASGEFTVGLSWFRANQNGDVPAHGGKTIAMMKTAFGDGKTPDRAGAFYAWASAKLFRQPVAMNTGDDFCGGDVSTASWCNRKGTFPELVDIRLGAPLEPEPAALSCEAGSTTRCLFMRRYTYGLVLSNMSDVPRAFGGAPTGLAGCRYLNDAWAYGAPVQGGACVNAVPPSTVGPRAGLVYRYDTRPHAAKDVQVHPTAAGAFTYVLHADGTIISSGGAPAVTGPRFGFDIARALALRSDGVSGWVLDGYGALHPFGGAPAMSGSPYWPGWDIARDVVLLSDAGGYVLDGFGGLHPFGNAPKATHAAYWSGWDIARSVVLTSSGRGGYVLDGFGGLHPFAVGSAAPPAAGANTAYWPSWDIARSLVLGGDDRGGFVLDGLGGLHPFSVVSAPARLQCADPLACASPNLPAVAVAPAEAGAYVVVTRDGAVHRYAAAP